MTNQKIKISSQYETTTKEGLKFTGRITVILLEGYFLALLFLLASYFLKKISILLHMGGDLFWIAISYISSGLGVLVFIIFSIYGLIEVCKMCWRKLTC